MLQSIDRYILKQILIPLFMTLLIAALLLLLEKMLRLFDFIVNQGGPVEVVWKMLANLLPEYLALAVPIGLFLGVLMAFRKLALNSELDALLSCGLSLTRMVRMAIVLAIVLLIVNVFISGFLQPYSHYAYKGLRFEIKSGALGASIKTGDFTNLGNGLILRIEESRKDGTELHNIFAQSKNDNGRVVVISAQKGRFFATPSEQTIVLRLFDGTIVDLNPKDIKPRVLTFNVHDLPVDVPDFASFRERGSDANAREFTLPELWDHMRSDHENLSYAAAFHARVARAISILFIPLLAVPLGLVAKRSGKALGITVGLVLLISLHKILQFGEAFSATGSLSPYLAIWGPTLLFIFISLRLFYIGAYTVGGQPLRRIEIIYDVVSSAFRKLTQRLSAVN